MKGPWYSLTEVKKKLSLTDSELQYLIEEKEIRVVVKTKEREFLAFYLDENKRRIGIGSFTYRGHLFLTQTHISKLLDGEEVVLGEKGVAAVLEREQVKDWKCHYPYRIRPPYCGISEWIAVPFESIEYNKILATPKPKEIESPEWIFAKAIKDISKFTHDYSGIKNPNLSVDNEHQTEMPNRPQYELYYKGQAAFEPSDLRVPADELVRYKQSITEQLKKQESYKEGLDATGRRNQLHELIHRAINDNPNGSTTKLWKTIYNDWCSENPIYDTEEIIQRMDSLAIEWISSNYIEQSLSRKSFGPTVSKIKKRLLSD